MATNNIDISGKLKTQLTAIKAALLSNEVEVNSNQEVLEEAVNILYNAMKSSDDDTHLNLFGIRKFF